MYLHENKDLFEKLIIETANEKKVLYEIVEKDYYVTIFLKELVKEVPDIIFKGGTSLSKCFKLINRFSEDIDLNVITDNKISNSKRKKIKYSIVKVAEKLSFPILNIEDTRSRRDYNLYKIEFDTLFSGFAVKNLILIETFFSIRSFPVIKEKVNCLLYDYIKSNDQLKFLSTKYDLEDFSLYVQTIERTFIDKIFALCEYYLKNKVERYSRHLYDIHKLFPMIKFDNDFKKLVNEARNARFSSQNSLSMLDDKNVNDLLNEVINKNYYKSDFAALTANLLFEKISYEEVIITLKKVIQLNIF